MTAEAPDFQRIFSETHMTLGTAAKLIPSILCEGETINRSTVLRWVKTGFVLPGPTGKRRKVKLEAVLLPGGFLTSKEAVGRFLESIQPVGGEPVQFSTPISRQKESEQARAEMRKLGLKV